MAKKLEAPNYAKDKEFAQQFANQRLSQWELLRSERNPREILWREYYDMWSLGDQDPNNKQNYIGKANIHFPQARKEVETMSRRLVKAMFPEDYLKADPTQFVEENAAIVNTQTVRHFYDNVMHMQMKLMPWVKQCVLYGTSPMRQFWHKEVNEVIYKKRYFKEDERGMLIPDFKKVKELITIYNAPKTRVEDIYQTWIYPTTAIDPTEIQTTYFRTKVTFDDLKKKEKDGLYVNVNFLKDQGKEMDQQFSETQVRMQAMGDSGTLVGEGATKLYDLLEVWGKAEINGKVIPYVCEIINEKHCVRIQQNPYWHQTSPFIFGRFILPPGPEFYARGIVEAILSLQHQLDDTINQGMDSTTLSLNQITIVNPAYAPNVESFEIEPGAIWWADPNAVKPFQFPDLSDTYIKNTNMIRQAITEISDNTPQLPDPIAGKARSTGQAQLAINEWQTDLYSFVNQLILEGLQPMAKQTHMLLQQFLDDDTVIRINGKYSDAWINRIVTASDIIGDMEFKWMGSIQVENQSVKTQQMLSFLKIWPMVPQNAQVNIKWDNLIIKLLRDGFQIKDIENIIGTKDLNDSVPPNIENRVLSKGGFVEVSDFDDDAAHLNEHIYQHQKEKDPFIRALYLKHELSHKDSALKKQQLQQQQQTMMAQQQALIAAQTKPGPGHPSSNPQANPVIKQNPQGPPNPNGNQTQLSQSTNPGDLSKGLR